MTRRNFIERLSTLPFLGFLATSEKNVVEAKEEQSMSLSSPLSFICCINCGKTIVQDDLEPRIFCSICEENKQLFKNDFITQVHAQHMRKALRIIGGICLKKKLNYVDTIRSIHIINQIAHQTHGDCKICQEKWMKETIAKYEFER